jgi:hypothetical protein|tara:strand:- start:22 stop:276 length:255 start_codon:yes stop_codon:yes gene_type:complete
MTAEEIKELIEEKTNDVVMILANVKSSPRTIFYVSKRTEDDYNGFDYLVKGFCAKTNEPFTDGFIACDSVQSAQQELQRISMSY